jgi:dephospho-CoA kinase
MTRERNDTAPFRVALTGGIASGKSTVADAFAALGVAVIDTDAIAHALTAPGQPAVRSIAEALGPDVLDARGHLDRARLRARVFADPAQRARLEAILHPLILAEMDRRSALAPGPYHIVVVPLLFEAGLEGRFDRVLVVDAPESAQIERLRARDGETEEGAARILAAQTSRAERLARADDVIVNDGTPADLAARVAALHRFYSERAAAKKK